MLFAGAAVVDRAGLIVVDFIDNFLVDVPLEVGLRGAEAGGNRVHFFQNCIQVAGVGGLGPAAPTLKPRVLEATATDEEERRDVSFELSISNRFPDCCLGRGYSRLAKTL